MSSVRGTGSRGVGRGNTPPAARGGGVSRRGRAYQNTAPRAGASTRGSFGLPSNQDAKPLPREPHTARISGRNQQAVPSSAFGTARTTGTWQERYQTVRNL